MKNWIFYLLFFTNALLFLVEGSLIVRPVLGILFFFLYTQTKGKLFKKYTGYFLWIPFAFEFLLIKDPSWSAQWGGLLLHSAHFFFWLGLYFLKSPNSQSLVSPFSFSASLFILLASLPLNYGIPLSILPAFLFLAIANQKILQQKLKTNSLILSIGLSLFFLVLFFQNASQLQNFFYSKFYRGGAQIGFDQQTDLNGFTSLYNSPKSSKIVLEIETQKPQLYLGGIANEKYIKGHWSHWKKNEDLKPQGSIINHFIFAPQPILNQDIEAIIYPADGFKSQFLFSAYSNQGVAIPEDSISFQSGYYGRKKSKFKQVYYLLRNKLDSTNSPAKPHIKESNLKDSLQLFLAKNQLNHPNPDSLAHNISKFFNRSFEYSLQISKPKNSVEPILHFLFNTQIGYCEWFASAGTLLLQSQNIPARFVKGFAFPLKISDTHYAFRMQNAHAWVEYWNGKKWILWDPTPIGFTPENTAFSLWESYIKSVSHFFKRIWFQINEGQWIASLDQINQFFTTTNWKFNKHLLWLLLLCIPLGFIAYKKRKNEYRKLYTKVQKIYRKNKWEWDYTMPLLLFLEEKKSLYSQEEKEAVQILCKFYKDERFKP